MGLNKPLIAVPWSREGSPTWAICTAAPDGGFDQLLAEVHPTDGKTWEEKDFDARNTAGALLIRLQAERNLHIGSEAWGR